MDAEEYQECSVKGGLTIVVDAYAGPMSCLLVGLILQANAEQTGIFVFAGWNGWRCGSNAEIGRIVFANFDL